MALASVFAGFSSVVVELSCKNKLRCTRHKIAHEAKCHHVPVVVLLQLPALFQLWLHLLLVPECKVHTLGMSHFLHAHIRTLKTLSNSQNRIPIIAAPSPQNATKSNRDLHTPYAYDLMSPQNMMVCHGVSVCRSW